MRNDNDGNLAKPPIAAGNGLIHRRALLGRGVAFAGTIAGGTATATAAPLVIEKWSREPGGLIAPYGRPDAREHDIVRTLVNPDGQRMGVTAARTPLHRLDGTVTPNGLHYVVARNGIPAIDPDKHRLLIHGLVKQSLLFSVDALHRYPMVSRTTFLESAGNSTLLYSPTPVQANVQALHGLCSCAEWTGVKLSTLIEEAGIDAKAKWLITEGADAPNVTSSVPLAKAMEDAIIALYQNGEPIYPENGYPMRLLLPGYEGAASIKWLRRIKLVEAPAMDINDVRYSSILLPSGKSVQFFFTQEVKSFITRPSPGLNLRAPGYYEISGLAFSGNGKISRVDVSADGGKSWAEAALQEPVLSKAFTRFRMAWEWNGGPSVLLSRATDEGGNVQPARAALMADRGEAESAPSFTSFKLLHCNAITAWGISSSGEVSHVYA
jgi:sulfane dehydrogenase subunit SoxC